MTPQLVPGSRFFYVHELACKHCGLLKFHPGFLSKLDEMRIVYGNSIVPSNGCRCFEHNVAIKGHKRSLHVADTPHWAIKGQKGCLAIDVPIGGQPRGDLIHAAWGLGWSIGLAKWGVHLDWRIALGFEQTTFDY